MPDPIRTPNRWSTFEMSRQTEEDYACALHCIVSAAASLRRQALADLAAGLLERLSARESKEFARRMQDGPGLGPKRVRMLTCEAGLSMWRPRKQHLEQFETPGLWIAMVRDTFPVGGTASVEPFDHYVLVLEYLRDDEFLLIADPHPSRPNVYRLRDTIFEQAWDGCSRSRWSARLSE